MPTTSLTSGPNPIRSATNPRRPLERRRNPRLSCRAAVTGSAGSGSGRMAWSGEVTNLSATGMAVEIPTWSPVKPGAPVQLRLDVPAPDAAGPATRRIRCRVDGRVMWSRPAPDGRPAVHGIRLSRLLSEFQERGRAPLSRLAAILAMGVIAVVITGLKTYNIQWFWYDPWFQAYSLGVTLYIVSRIVLAVRYRLPAESGFTPTVSVVIAVKNERAHIAETIHRCFRSRYPARLMDVIVVDDGSTDGTWDVIDGLRSEYPGLRAFRFDANRGKRHAMALGAERASGEILVYVDSDSYVDPEAIYRLVQGFTDPRVGAVAGHIRVIVEPHSVISKMESVRYFISHKIMKAAEGIFGCVTCCSGAFSAYRRSAVMPNLPQWLHQTFLGQPATFGDDRSLTNFVLRGYRVLYCDSAYAWTYVPATWRQYFRQQLRWKKSWSRETLTAVRLMWRKQPMAAASYYAGVLLTLCAPFMVIRNVIVLPLTYSISMVPYLAGLAAIYLFFCCLYFYHSPSEEWSYGIIFAGVYVAVLCWQNYYAMATISRTHWGTR